MQQTRQNTILVVDDDRSCRILLETMLAAEGHAVRCVASGEEALAMVTHCLPDLILLDLMMPGLDGLEVARRLKAGTRTGAIPIIMVSAMDDRASRISGLEAGAEEFICKPVDSAELQLRVKNMLRIKALSDSLADHDRLMEEQVITRTRQLIDSHRDNIFTLARAAEYHDEDTGMHIKRVSDYSKALAERMGMDETFCDAIFYASSLHDVGKIGVSAKLLRKPAKLNAVEWKLMKKHPEQGARILGEFPSSLYLKMGKEITLGHHERWDGSGYPHGRCGEETPLSARIMMMGDIYDALRANRPYKEAYTHERAVEVITTGDGRTLPAHFDPAVMAAFKAGANTFREIYAAHAD